MILITDEPLDPEATTALVCKRSNGAVVTFLGVTRDTTADRRVLHLEYEAYRPMADKKLAEIAREVSEEWAVEDVAIAHRVGRLEIGDVSLVVAVASPHRKIAFAASQHIVDRIKQTVPIWKKEFFEGGEVWVESPRTSPCGSARLSPRNARYRVVSQQAEGGSLQKSALWFVGHAEFFWRSHGTSWHTLIIWSDILM